MKFRPSNNDINVAVFSCYFGNHEPFNATALSSAGTADKFLFTDNDIEVPSGVQVINLRHLDDPPYLASRIPKLCPHRYFADFDWTVYIDNSARFTRPVTYLLKNLETSFGSPAPAQRYVFRHPKRNSVFDEIDACIKIGAVTSEEKKRLVRVFNDAGLKRHSGLGQHTLMVQRMGDPATDNLNEVWLDLFKKLSRRDQLTLRLAECVTGVNCQYLECRLLDYIDWPIFRRKHRFMFQNYGMTELPKNYSRKDFAYRLRRTFLKRWL